MTERVKRPRGRPAKPESERRRSNLTLRAHDDMRAKLEKGANAYGRSLSEEAEFRLNHSFEVESQFDQMLDLAFGSQLGGLMMLIGYLLRDVGNSAGFGSTFTLVGAKEWLNNPYAFDQATKALAALMEQLRPEGEIEVPRLKLSSGPDLGDLYSHLGSGFVATYLEAVAGQGRTTELQTLGTAVEDRLGPAVVDRVRRRLAEPKEQNG
jgi:hypothetical protein